MDLRERTPYLIQRVDLNKYPKDEAVGVDAFFRFDYMGSAEFEYGALHKALKAMRAEASSYPPDPVKIEDENGRVIWFVGPESRLDCARGIFADQSYDKREIRLKERTNMAYAYQPERDGDGERAPVGWRAIDQENPWLLFTEKEHASAWLARMEKT